MYVSHLTGWNPRLFGIGCTAIAMALMNWAQPSIILYRVDSSRSTIELGVYRGGLFKALGHDHRIDAKRVSGTVRYNPGDTASSSVSLAVDSHSLIVVDPNTSEKERSDVQSTMESAKVLDAQVFPTIAFSSTGVSRVTQAAGGLDIRVTGRLNLHGVEKEITIPVRISFDGNYLRATGTSSVIQSDFNIVPIRLAGGTVRVKDPVQVKFDIVAVKGN